MACDCKHVAIIEQVAYLLSKEVRDKVKGWRKKEGRDGDAIEQAKGDQGAEQGGG